MTSWVSNGLLRDGGACQADFDQVRTDRHRERVGGGLRIDVGNTRVPPK